MTVDGPQIRRATSMDSLAIIPLLVQLGYPTNVENVRNRFEQLLPDERFACWVADNGGELVGLATGHLSWHIELNHPIARLTALVVDKHTRGQGLAHRLTAGFEEWAREKGAIDASLNSGDTRSGAHAVYEKLGWTATGKRFVKKLAP